MSAMAAEVKANDSPVQWLSFGPTDEIRAVEATQIQRVLAVSEMARS